MDAAGRRSGWGYPPSRPFILLGIYFIVTAVQVASVAARPPLPDTRVGALWVIFGVALVLAAVTAIAWARWANAVLPVLVALAVLQSAAAVVVSAGGQGQLVSGLYLIVLGVFAGYFLSVRAVRAFTVLAAVGFGSAVLVNPLLDTPAYGIAVIVVAAALALIVSSLVQRLRAESVADPLTGALNRRGLEESALLLHGVDGRSGASTAVVEIDLDGFKDYNDTHGHQAGDELLASLVRDWSPVLRRTDLLARTGGDEFVIVLPTTKREEADVLLARLRHANAAPWSAGTAIWEQGEPLLQAVRRADEAMYASKPPGGSRSRP